jgi:hypothetical protein
VTSDFAPPADLADRVSQVWRRSGQLPLALPQPSVDLLVFADGSLRLTGPETEARTGTLTEPLTGVRLRPGTCASVLGIAADEVPLAGMPLPGLGLAGGLRALRAPARPADQAIGHSLEPLITARVHALLASAGSTFDLIGEVASPLSVHTIADLLGVQRLPDFVRWTEAITSFFGMFTADEARQTAFHQAVAEMSAYFRAESERPTGIIATLTASDLTEDELINFCTLLLINGHETTKTLLVNAILCLASQPKPADIGLAVEEVLRYLPPTGGTDRFVTRPTTLGGHELQPGQRVVAMITAANRDPEVFADPHTFDPDRTANPHLSFGHGIHFCMGAHLARMQVRIALTALLDRPWQIADLDTHRTPVGIDVLKLTLA